MPDFLQPLRPSGSCHIARYQPHQRNGGKALMDGLSSLPSAMGARGWAGLAPRHPTRRCEPSKRPWAGLVARERPSWTRPSSTVATAAEAVVTARLIAHAPSAGGEQHLRSFHRRVGTCFPPLESPAEAWAVIIEFLGGPLALDRQLRTVAAGRPRRIPHQEPLARSEATLTIDGATVRAGPSIPFVPRSHHHSAHRGSP